MKTLISLLCLCLCGCAGTKVPIAADPEPVIHVPAALMPFSATNGPSPVLLSAKPQARPLVVAPAPASVILLQGAAEIQWNASTDSDVAGYNIYYGANSREYTNAISAIDTNAIVAGLDYWQTYYFAITATAADGRESGFSDEASVTIPKTLELHFDFTGDHLLSSTDLVNWSTCDAQLAGNAWRVTIAPAAGSTFFRAGGMSQ